MSGADQDERVVLVPAAHVEGVEGVVLDGEDGAGVRDGDGGGRDGGGGGGGGAGDDGDDAGYGVAEGVFVGERFSEGRGKKGEDRSGGSPRALIRARMPWYARPTPMKKIWGWVFSLEAVRVWVQHVKGKGMFSTRCSCPRGILPIEMCGVSGFRGHRSSLWPVEERQ